MTQRYLIMMAVALTCLTAVGTKLAAADGSQIADAVEQRRFEAALELIDNGIDIHDAQPDGMTALHWAVHHDHAATVESLLNAGAHVNAINLYGVSPLSLACQNGNAKIVQRLLAAGADANTKLPGGESVLMTAARTGRVEPVKLLIAAGADVHAIERKGQTALMWAAADGHAEVVDILLNAGAKHDVQLGSGFDALLFAVRGGKIDVAKRLIRAGADVNRVQPMQQGLKLMRGKTQMTPLLLAIENGHFELAFQLLDIGADPNLCPSGYSALHAITWVRKPIRGDGDPSPKGSGRYNSLDMVRKLASAGADLNARLKNGKSGLGQFNYSGSTPLLLAAQASDVPLMELLVELGADARIPNVDRSTPLLAAAGVGALGDGDETAGTEEEMIATVKYLLSLGLDINAVDNNGETVMHGAAYQSCAKLVQELVNNGADAHVWNNENRAGWTPYIIAAGYRPGNFRPSPETMSVLEQAMRAEVVKIPVLPEREERRRSWNAIDNASGKWLIKDLEYARIDEKALLLDLHFPRQVAGSKLLVWVHGGAWRGGSKSDMPLQSLVNAGYTIASVDYRLSTEARFPAQIHDIKASIRFLRQLAGRYGYDAEKIMIAGASAGGHLAALVGTTNDHTELEGTVGDHLEQSSNVHLIIDFYGPTNLQSILAQSTPHGLSVRVPALQLLLGGQPDELPELARLASPLSHVDAADPPLLMIHGDQDPQVPINQSHELAGKYKEFGRPFHFEVIHGGVHGGKEFFDEVRIKILQNFVKQYID